MTVTQTFRPTSANHSFRTIYTVAREYAFPHLWVWVTAAALAAVDAIWIAIDPRISFDLSDIVNLLPAFLLIPVLVWRLSLLDEKTNPIYVRLIRCVMMIYFILPTLCAIKVFNHLMMSVPMPLLDSTMAAWDRSLGLDWIAYGKAIANLGFINPMLDKAYYLLMPGVFFIGFEAIIVGEKERCSELLALILLTAIFALFVAGLLPAKGAMEYLSDESFRALFSKDSGNYSVPQLNELRGTLPVVIGASNLHGLACFPSFHAIASILLMYSSRGNLFRHVVSCVFATAVLASTPTFGGHYFVDIIAGAFVAVGFIFMIRRHYPLSKT
jgi:hypothetical protein